MRYYIHLTVNTAGHEYDFSMLHEDSLDAVMLRVLHLHPSATSVVMSIVPDKDGMNVTF